VRVPGVLTQRAKAATLVMTRIRVCALMDMFE
jgi:hypothetical protein